MAIARDPADHQSGPEGVERLGIAADAVQHEHYRGTCPIAPLDRCSVLYSFSIYYNPPRRLEAAPEEGHVTVITLRQHIVIRRPLEYLAATSASVSRHTRLKLTSLHWRTVVSLRISRPATRVKRC